MLIEVTSAHRAAGAWFCSSECSCISATLREHVKAGARAVEGEEEYSWQIMRVRLFSNFAMLQALSLRPLVFYLQVTGQAQSVA